MHRSHAVRSTFHSLQCHTPIFTTWAVLFRNKVYSIQFPRASRKFKNNDRADT